MKTEILLNLAKTAIEDELLKKESLDISTLQEEYEFLNEIRACFVTLYLNSSLRGCMGSLLPRRKLIDDITHNAKAAAFNDFRFQSLSLEDFKNIKIEVSILSLPKQVIYSSINELKEKIKINIHGVILEQGQSRATFLPQVWEQLPTFEEFFLNLSKKAGLSENCLESFPKIFVYEVDKFKE